MLPKEEYRKLIQNPILEQIQKIFHLLTYSEKTFLLNESGDNKNAPQILTFILTTNSFSDYVLKDALKYAIRNWKNLEMIKLFIEITNEANFETLRRSVKIGRLNVVKFLIEEKSIQLSDNRPFDQALMWTAVSEKQFEIVKYLVSKNVLKLEPIRNYLESALKIAVYRGYFEIFKFLIEESEGGVDVKASGFDGENLLHLASQHGFLEIVKYLIEKCGFDVNSQNNNGNTALLIASAVDSFEVVKYLVEESPSNINHVNNDGMTALSSANVNGNIQISQYLIKKLNSK